MLTKVLPLFADPVCGNGRCDAPMEYRQWGHSGCMADCGYFGEKTNLSLTIEVNLTKHMLLGVWTEDEWTNVVWDLCSPRTHKALCAYNQSQELQQQYRDVLMHLRPAWRVHVLIPVACNMQALL